MLKPLLTGSSLENLDNLPSWLTAEIDVGDLICPVPHDLTPEHAAALIVNSAERTQRFLACLRRLRVHSKRRRKIAARIGVQAKSLHITALFRTLRDLHISVMPNGGWSYERVVRSACGLDMWAPLHGEILMSIQDGAGGKQRPVFRLTDVLDISRHRIALAIQQALQTPHVRQLAARGGGADHAFKQCIRTHLPEMAKVLIADIPSCFLSLRKSGVEDGLLLPSQVTRGLLTRPISGGTDPEACATTSVRPNGPRSNGRGSPTWVPRSQWHLLGAGSCPGALDGEYGVLPGLPLAASAAEVVLAPVLTAIEAAAPGVVAILWVDDFIVLLPRKEDEEAVRSAFAEAIRNAICEPSQLKLRQGIKRFDPNTGFPALGYYIRLRGSEIDFAPKRSRALVLADKMFEEINAYPERFSREVARQRIEASFQRFEGPTGLGQALRVWEEIEPALADVVRPCLPSNKREDGRLQIYTDGSCRGAPGPGGWAVVRAPNAGCGSPKSSAEIVRKGAIGLTTSSEMELTAVLMALAQLPEGTRVTVFSDSSYVVKNAKNALAQWKTNGWKTTLGKSIANGALWRRLSAELERLDVQLKWVKGHSSNQYNRLADRIAKEAMLDMLKKQNALLTESSSACPAIACDEASARGLHPCWNRK